MNSVITIGNPDLYAVCQWVLLDSKAPRAIRAAAFDLLPKAYTCRESSTLKEKLPPAVWEEITTAIKAQQRITAIKVLRGATQMTLKDAKDAIDHEFPL